MRVAVLAALLALGACSTMQEAQWNDVACRAQAAANAFTDATEKSDPKASAASALASAVFGSQCVPLVVAAK